MADLALGQRFLWDRPGIGNILVEITDTALEDLHTRQPCVEVRDLTTDLTYVPALASFQAKARPIEPGKIIYMWGNAVEPQGDGPKIIAHICNNIGAWGAGFVLAVSGKWEHVKHQYMAWSVGNDRQELPLGEVQFVLAEEGIYVANMIGQDNIRGAANRPPIRYVAVAVALAKVAEKAAELGASVHMPRIGCGLAGGTWEEVEPIIMQQLCERGIPVFVYDLRTP